MTPGQCRAARGFLDWTVNDLACAASLPISTVSNYEKGRRLPHVSNITAMEAVLIAAGITFRVSGSIETVGYEIRTGRS